MGGNKKRNKKDANASANENVKSGIKKKSHGKMYEKQEENKDGTFDELDSSPAWSREENEHKAMRETDDVPETSEEAGEFIRTTEQTHNAVAAKKVKDIVLQDELSQPEHVVNETELLPTTTQDELDAGDISSDIHAKNQASISTRTFDGGEAQDIANSKPDLGDGFEAQVVQEDLKVTTSEDEKEDVVASTVEGIVRHSELGGKATFGKHCGSVPSAQLEPHQQPSPVSSKQLLSGPKTTTEDQSGESQASINLPAQEAKLYNRLAPSLQGILEHTRDQSTQTPKPTTHDQGTQKGTSTDAPGQEPKRQGRSVSPFRGIFKKPSNTPASSTESPIQEKRIPDGRPEPRLGGILKRPSKDSNENSVQLTQKRTSPEQERLIRDLARQIPAKDLDHTTRLAKPDIPRQIQPDPVLPPTLPLRSSRTLQSGQTLSTTNGPILKLIVDNYAYSFVANREHVLATNTIYFSAHACDYTGPPFGRDFGRYVNFSGKQFSLEVIKEYSQWLYDGIIRTMASLVRVTPINADITLKFLARCYIFGEHIDDKRWMNDIVDAFISVHIRDWRLELDDVILYTYEFAKQRSPIRKLLIDMYAYCLKPSDNVKVKLRELPAEFAIDIFMALDKVGTATSRDWRERLNNSRTYHV